MRQLGTHNSGINVLFPNTETFELGFQASEGRDKASLLPISPEYIFFGVSSHFASISSILVPLSQHTPTTFAHEPGSSSNHVCNATELRICDPSFSTVSRLFATFYRSVHVWYPVMSNAAFRSLLSSAQTTTIDACLSPSQELLYLILAISSQLTRRSELQSGMTPAAYFSKATSNVDTSCDHSSGSQTIHMMQRSLLICIYLLLSPAHGDIWRNLGFAIRLYFDMSHGRFENLDSLDESHLAMLARTLYCIEGYILNPSPQGFS